jgi:NAD(P)-dependent dehydrogenase (short-subunit alcohol dehydrogenase family)
MDLELGGKTAVVTGGSRGIGAAIAGVLAEEGVDVCLVARSRDDLDGVAKHIKSRSNRRIVTHVADLMDPKAPAESIKAAVDAFGRLDILVNNAGATKRGSFFELADEDWVTGFGLKFFATMRMTRSAWPHLRASQGAIVNIIGVGSRVAQGDYTVGGPVNSALVNFTKATADVARTEGIRINAINPGHIRTSRLEKRIDTAMGKFGTKDREEAKRRLVAEYGINRFGEPHEIGWLVAYLCSSRAGFMHSSIIDIDGGMTKAL